MGLVNGFLFHQKHLSEVTWHKNVNVIQVIPEQYKDIDSLLPLNSLPIHCYSRLHLYISFLKFWNYTFLISISISDIFLSCNKSNPQVKEDAPVFFFFTFINRNHTSTGTSHIISSTKKKPTSRKAQKQNRKKAALLFLFSFLFTLFFEQ